MEYKIFNDQFGEIGGARDNGLGVDLAIVLTVSPLEVRLPIGIAGGFRRFGGAGGGAE